MIQKFTPPAPELVVAQWLMYKEGYRSPTSGTWNGATKWPFKYTIFGYTATWKLKNGRYAAPSTHRKRLIDYAYKLYGPGYGLKVAAAFALYDLEHRRVQDPDS